MNLLENAKAELEGLLEQRAELDRKIKAVQEAIKLFEPIYATVESQIQRVQQFMLMEDMENIGITQAVERALMSVPDIFLPPTSVRDKLVDANFKLVGENPMASIHQVLKRLVARDKSPFVAEEHQGQTLYKYDPSRYPASMRRYQEGLHPAYMPASSDPMTTPPPDWLKTLKGQKKK
jgi:hypothetical protein